MKTLLSFIEWEKYFREYESKEDFKNSLINLGLDGIEIVKCGEELELPREIIHGIHLPFFTSWVDYYNNDRKRVVEEFGEYDIAKGFYTLEYDRLSDYYIKDLEFSKKNCEYSVFHVANANSLEYFSQKHHLTDIEVIDASAKLINEMIKKVKIDNYFLLENLYFPGLQFNDVSLTKRLIEKIEYDKIGFMLDIGHLMNTNPYLKTEDEGWDYVEEIINSHIELIDYFKGVHLHVSISGKNILDLKENTPLLCKDFYDRFEQIHNIVKSIDTHSISTSKKAKKVIEKINPEYLVLEFTSENRADREEKIKKQLINLK